MITAEGKRDLLKVKCCEVTFRKNVRTFMIESPTTTIISEQEKSAKLYEK